MEAVEKAEPPSSLPAQSDDESNGPKYKNTRRCRRLAIKLVSSVAGSLQRSPPPAPPPPLPPSQTRKKQLDFGANSSYNHKARRIISTHTPDHQNTINTQSANVASPFTVRVGLLSSTGSAACKLEYSLAFGQLCCAASSELVYIFRLARLVYFFSLGHAEREQHIHKLARQICI